MRARIKVIRTADGRIIPVTTAIDNNGVKRTYINCKDALSPEEREAKRKQRRKREAERKAWEAEKAAHRKEFAKKHQTGEAQAEFWAQVQAEWAAVTQQ